VKWTLLALIRAPFPGAAAVSRNTAPVNHSAGPGVVSLVLMTFITMLLGRAASLVCDERDTHVPPMR